MTYTVIDVNENVFARNIADKQALYAWANKHSQYIPVKKVIVGSTIIITVAIKDRA